VGQLKVNGDGVTLLSPIKSTITNLNNRIPLIWRKDEALNDLRNNNKIPSEMYEDLHRNFEGALNQLKEKGKVALNKMSEQTARCAFQIKQLNSALINLEIEREIGKVDEEMYQTAMGIVQEELKRNKTEKTDLEQMKSNLSNLMLGESVENVSEEETQLTTEEKEKGEDEESPSDSSPPNLPEPPVVVYVKNSKKKDVTEESNPA